MTKQYGQTLVDVDFRELEIKTANRLAGRNSTDKVIAMYLLYGASIKRVTRQYGWRRTRVVMKRLGISFRVNKRFSKITISNTL